MMQQLMVGAAKSRFRLDPRTKILILIVINIMMMGGGIEGVAIIARPVVASIPLFLLMSERRTRASIMYLALFALASFGESYLVPRTTDLANLLIVIVSGLITRFMPGLVMGYYVVTTTTVSEFTASMERMRVTPKLIIPMSVMFRFFPTVIEEARAISDSMKMRGIGGISILKSPVSALEYRLVPLMVCVVKIGEELSAAALTRGLGSSIKRTNICRIGFTWRDGLLTSVSVISAVCMMAL